jgi:hypothetical protein
VGCLQCGQRLGIGGSVVALPANRRQAFVRNETKPRQILEDRVFKRRTAADPVVILDAQEHTPATHAGQTPDVDCVDHVTEVQIAGGRGSEAGSGLHGL